MEDVFANALGEAPSRTTERRDSSRVRFSVMAKVTEVASDTTLEVRIADIGRLGCYADSPNPFPPGTVVRISFLRTGIRFESDAAVVYSVAGLGMGLKFVDLAAGNAAQIEKWLFEGDSQELLAEAAEMNGEAAAAEKKALRRLVELLVQKRALTGLEGEEILEILRHKQFREQP